MDDKFRPLDGPLKPGEPCYPNPGPMFGGGIGSMGWTGWVGKDVPRQETRKQERERLSGIERILSAVVRFFYTGKEPEEPPTIPLSEIPGTLQYRMRQLYEGRDPDYIPLSDYTGEDKDNFYNRHDEAEEQKE